MVTRPSQTVQINNSSLSNASVLFSQMNQKMMSGENHQFQTHQFQHHHHHLPYPGFLDLAHVEPAEQESEEEAQMSDDSDASESSNRSRKKRKTNAKKAKKTGEKKSGGVLKRKTCNRWTKKENDMLAKAIQLYGEKKWNDIAKYVGSKNSDQCNQHWHRVLNPKICKKPWSLEEDQGLADRVAEYGESSWKKVAEGIKGRTDIQCRHRWIMLKKYESQGKGRPMSRTNKTKNSFGDSEYSNSSNGSALNDEIEHSNPEASLGAEPTTPTKELTPISNPLGLQDRLREEQNLVCDEEPFDVHQPLDMSVTPRSFFRSIKLDSNNNDDDDLAVPNLIGESPDQPIVINRPLQNPTSLSLISPNAFPQTYSASDTFREFFGSPKSGSSAATLRSMITQDPLLATRNAPPDQLFEQAYQEINDYFIGNSSRLSHLASPNHSHTNLLHSFSHQEEFLH